MDCIQKMLYCTVIRMYMISNNTQVGPKCAIIYLPHHKPEPSIQVRLDPYFHVDYTKFSTCNLVSKLQMSMSGEPVPIVCPVNS